MRQEDNTQWVRLNQDSLSILEQYLTIDWRATSQQSVAMAIMQSIYRKLEEELTHQSSCDQP